MPSRPDPDAARTPRKSEEEYAASYYRRQGAFWALALVAAAALFWLTVR